MSDASGLFAANSEQPGKQTGGRSGMRFRLDVIEMSGRRTIFHAGEMDMWRGFRVLYAPDMDRSTGNPIIQLDGMSPSLVILFLRRGRVRLAIRFPFLSPGGMASFLGTLMR